MLKKGLFKRPKNELEVHAKYAKFEAPNVPDEMCLYCPSCGTMLFINELSENFHVCMKCGHHFKINSRQRLNCICDENTFEEIDCELASTNILDFPDYDKKLKNALLESGENEAVSCGLAKVGGINCAIFVMDSFFMMGSMGSVVGEKITRLFERATKLSLPVIGFTVSGGARMQEGIISLMQMAKTSGAVKRHSDAGMLYITVLTNPTSGGVTASFAMEGDIIIAEPNALVCFAGPRVIEQTIRQKLPVGFQRSEFVLEKGFIDAIVHRSEQKEYIARLLSFHTMEEINESI